MTLLKRSTIRTALLAAAIGTLLLPCAAWLSGCDGEDNNPLVPSVRPLYHDTDLELDSGLLGTWTDESDDVKLVFEPDEQNQAYKLTISETEDQKETRGEFSAHLVHLGSDWLLDLYPNDLQSGSDIFKMHFVKAHTFVRIDRDRNQLQFAFLSSDWLREHIADKSVDTPHEMLDGGVLLTGSVDDLQDLLYLYADDTKAFSLDANFVRTPEPPQQE